ncbi:hypothetical protein [Rugamonas sp. DEMB1]|uniref:hypothetical protein n=1 Tax=Rugamonas sp. DEMB1 TaxID=3039386 RepID=UPI00244936C7|nr:hypothetical protein [Rugamonas sp. DEMB1]WGG52112.1 hypothetical protein QC826_08025 [Rugamonas sp. DEMB1]
MKKHILTAIVVVLTACSSPNDIILGPEPLQQMAEQGDKFKSMSEDDRKLLVAYLTANRIGKAFGADVQSPVGRTVGEVMKDAHAWKEKVKAAEVTEKKKADEALALKAKIEAERKAISARIEAMVTISVLNKHVLSKNYDLGRYNELLMISYALENKSQKKIKQIKGIVSFVDATGDPVGELHVDFDQPIKAGATIMTDTGSGWRTNQFSNGNIEKIANRENSSMTGKFTPLSIAFDDGEVLRAPE